MIFLFQILPEITTEMIFFSGVSAMGLLLLGIGWIISTLDGDIDFFGSDTNTFNTEGFVGGVNENNASEIIDDVSISEFDGDLPMPSFFSIKVLRIVMLCFGIGGNTGLRLGWSFSESLLLGTILGFSSGYILYRAFIYIYKQTIYNYRDPKIIGRTGKVYLDIPTNGFGQILVTIVGKRHIFRAVSIDNTYIQQGTPIIIKNKKKGTCFVEPIEN